MRRTRAAGRTITREVIVRFVAWLLPIAALFVVYPVVLYQRELDAELRFHEQENLRVIDVGAEVVTRDLQSAVADLSYLAGQSVVRDYLAHGAVARARLERDFLSFCRHKGIYDQIRFIDAEGAERVRVNYDGGTPRVVAEAELQSMAAQEYFTAAIALDPGQVYVSPFEINVEHGEIERPLKPVIRFATPIADDGRVAGVLVLNYLGRRVLDKLREVSAGYRGEISLIDGDGFYLMHPHSPEAEWGFQLGPGPNFATDHPAAWKAVATRAAGSVVSGEGLFTFRRIGPAGSPSRGLVLVAHRTASQLGERARGLLAHVLSAYSLAGPVLLVLIGYLAFAGAARRRQQEQIAESAARLRVLSTQLLTAQERERAGLSRDLHDDLGQVVTAVRLDLERAARETDPRDKDRLIAEALAASKTLMERVRAISTRLRPRILDDLGLKEATRSFLADCQRHLGVAVDADLRFERAEIPPEISENVYRILQEAVTNVARHSGVERCSVELHVVEDGLRLSVTDGGTGFDAEAALARGLGLLGMRERARLLGGTFRLRSAPGDGTRIDVLIPLPPAGEPRRP
ncbi:MAG TPA: cache domain-containing protein [Candidatus Polarisedimenticolaceae bacterium]|nr:cache domain-containing protein [Candidatus Polarisedimenticolaceae bacterium]